MAALMSGASLLRELAGRRYPADWAYGLAAGEGRGVRRRLRSLAGVLTIFVAPAVVTGGAPDPEAPVPPATKFEVLDLKVETIDLESAVDDLKFRTEAVGGVVQALAVRETATEIRIEMPADVLFDFDKAEIRPDAAKVLAQAAEVLRRHPNRTVVIEGHTDAKGSDEYNQRLSERRAQAVRAWLQQRGGLSGMALSTRGWGSKRPVAPNTKPDGSDDPEGRQKNRR
ncbi:MAG TPA: OmpA family protein, partial [Candidatus Binatia bacterium]|nr:OmpA family protein [Candidatus Binatia bacterium]